jgi:hypothetical protein
MCRVKQIAFQRVSLARAIGFRSPLRGHPYEQLRSRFHTTWGVSAAGGGPNA